MFKVKGKAQFPRKLKPQISQPKLHQIKHVGGVLESSRLVDYKTVNGFQIWSRFDFRKGQKPLLQSTGGNLYFEKKIKKWEKNEKKIKEIKDNEQIIGKNCIFKRKFCCLPNP